MVRPLAARAKGPGFDSSIVQHVRRLSSRAVTYRAVGIELVIGSFPSIAFGFNCVVTLSNVVSVHFAIAHQAIHSFGIGKLVPAISWGVIMSRR